MVDGTNLHCYPWRHTVIMAKNSDKPFSLHREINKQKVPKNKTNSDYPYRKIPELRGVRLERFHTFFGRIVRISAMQCFKGVLIPVCAVIPYLKKGFSSRADVFPGVPESAVAAANQLSALESLSHLTVSQHFHLNHLLLPQQNTATVYTVLTLDTRVGVTEQRCHHHCLGFPVMNCVI